MRVGTIICTASRSKVELIRSFVPTHFVSNGYSSYVQGYFEVLPFCLQFQDNLEVALRNSIKRVGLVQKQTPSSPFH
jgi:hypothetical protein